MFGQQHLAGKAAHDDNDFRLRQRNFTLQVCSALRQFRSLGNTALGRAAFGDIGHHGLRQRGLRAFVRSHAHRAHRFEHIVEQQARFSRERGAAVVFVFIGRITHHHPCCKRTFWHGHQGGVFSPSAQAAGLALGRGVGQCVPVQGVDLAQVAGLP